MAWRWTPTRELRSLQPRTDSSPLSKPVEYPLSPVHLLDGSDRLGAITRNTLIAFMRETRLSDLGDIAASHRVSFFVDIQGVDVSHFGDSTESSGFCLPTYLFAKSCDYSIGDCSTIRGPAANATRGVYSPRTTFSGSLPKSAATSAFSFFSLCTSCPFRSYLFTSSSNGLTPSPPTILSAKQTTLCSSVLGM